MSLIKCTECGKEISDDVSSCPNCGCPTNQQANKVFKNRKFRIISIIASLLILVVIGTIIIVPTLNNSKTNTKDLILNLNEEGELGNWKITITDTEILDIISMDEVFTFSPDDENKYLKVNCTITNNGTKSETFLPFLATDDETTVKLLYQEKYEFISSDLIGYRDDLHDATLNPLSTETGCIVFEIPDSVSSSSEELIIIFSSGNKNINFKIR